METCTHYNDHWDFSKLKCLDTTERNKDSHVTETNMAASVKEWINHHCQIHQKTHHLGF